MRGVVEGVDVVEGGGEGAFGGVAVRVGPAGDVGEVVVRGVGQELLEVGLCLGGDEVCGNVGDCRMAHGAPGEGGLGEGGGCQEGEGVEASHGFFFFFLAMGLLPCDKREETRRGGGGGGQGGWILKGGRCVLGEREERRRMSR